MAILILDSLSLSGTTLACEMVANVRLGSTSLATFGTPANDPNMHSTSYRGAKRRDPVRGKPASPSRSAVMGKSWQSW